MYEYKLKKIVSIYDGDTFTAEVDLGFGVVITEKFRLSYIDAPEVRGEEREYGLMSRDWLRKRMYEAEQAGKDIIIKTEKDTKGKYGRYLAEIFVDAESLNTQLVFEGLAEYKTY